jgi:hypothetical protein
MLVDIVSSTMAVEESKMAVEIDWPTKVLVRLVSCLFVITERNFRLTKLE